MPRAKLMLALLATGVALALAEPPVLLAQAAKGDVAEVRIARLQYGGGGN